MEPLQELEVILLAEDIPHTKFSQLCNALGYSYARGQSILATRLNNYRVAMQDILIDWKNEQTDPTQSRAVLASKLRGIGLGTLDDKLCKGVYQPKPCDPLKQTTPLQSRSDIYSQKISESLTVGQCREKLVNKYLNSFCKIHKAPWDPNDLADFKDLHTVVTMVKKDARGKDTTKKEILHGSVAEIFSAEVNGVLPRRILVSAPAGRGKTTAVAKMAYDWANRVLGSSLENLPLLFVVKLRNTCKQTSIAEAIRSQLLSDVTDLTKGGLHRFIKENQGICNILLDGLDEYAGIVANLGLGSNIVDVMLWEEFPDCRVLVTTRPHLEDFFNQGELPRVYTKMWIEGFSHNSSREYIDKFFASTSIRSTGQDLKDYLDDKPLINELVITPLFCLMVCHLWSENLLGNDITTQTELLDNVNVFMMHHANTKLNSKDKITAEKLHAIICQLGEVALAGLLDDAKRLVFTPRDFRRVPSALQKACEIGIVSKTDNQVTGIPQTHETSFTSIEFYHKLAQEHSAGKCLAAKTNKYLLRWKISKLDRVLQKIRTNIGDYENLIRFAAGTENSLCIRIMEAILSNSSLAESERYRILLDCSSETSGAEGSVSSLVQRCVTAQRILLKSPTVYTVVGMQNLPGQLKKQVRQLGLEGCVMSDDLTNGLWSCFETSFNMLHTLTISDSSLTFPLSPPELLSVKELHGRRVMPQSYEGLISSLPSLKEIDVTIDDDVEGNASQNTDTRSVSQSEDQHFPVNIKLRSLPSLSREDKTESREMVAEVDLLIREHTENCQWLQVTGLKGQDEETLVNLFVKSTQLKSLNLDGCGSQSDEHAVKESGLELSTEMTVKLWSCLRSVASLCRLAISDSSLNFPSSPPELPSVIKLAAERVTSQSYEGLLSSLPTVEELDITIDDAERDIAQLTAGLRRTGGQQLTILRLVAPDSLQPEKKEVSGVTMKGLGLLIREQTKKIQQLNISRVKGTDEENLVDLFESAAYLNSLEALHLQFLDHGSLNYSRYEYANYGLTIKDCQLCTHLTERLWTCLRSLTTMTNLVISDSSLSFPPSPPELTSVTKLKAKRVTPQSYGGLLSSIPNVKEIDIAIGNAENEDISQIQTSLCRLLTGQELTLIRLDEGEESVMPRETMRRLGLLTSDQAFREATLSRVFCGPGETVLDLVRSSTSSSLMSSSLYTEKFSASVNSDRHACNISSLTIRDCKLTAMITSSMWTCLRSFTSLDSLTISDSSLGFPPTSPELTSVTKLEAARVTSQSYEGLLSSFPGLTRIDITIDDAERDIPQITAGLRRTGGQQLTHINLQAQDSLPKEKKAASRETMRGLGLLIREQTKNLQVLWLDQVKCTDEEDLVYLIECCRNVKAMGFVALSLCETKRGGRLDSHLKSLTSAGDTLTVQVYHVPAELFTSNDYRIYRSF